jgi:hypothetical protein
MVVFWMWSTNERAGHDGRSWFELARRENLATLVSSQPVAAADAVPLPDNGRRGIDDDEHLAAYNAYLARLHQPPGSAS